jgi:O-antigen/teichoic acid export membrane protein
LFIRSVFLTLSTEFFTLGGSFLTGILLARGLSVPERGVMALVMALPWTVAGLANLGLPQANIYLVGRKKISSQKVLASSLTAALVLGALVIALLVPFREQALASFLKGLPQEYYLPLLLLVPLLLVDGVLLSILRARQRFDLFNLRRLANTVLLLAGFSAALLLVRGGLDMVVRVYLGVTVLLVFFNLVLTSRVVPVSLGFNRQHTAASLRFGLKSYLQNFSGALNYRLDIYLLTLFLNPEQVAYYAIATTVAEVAWYIPDTVGVVLFPRLANTPLDQINQITARVCRSTVALTGMIAAGIGAAAWLLVPIIYGHEYSASVLPLLILLPGIVFMGVYKVLTRNYSSRDRQQVSIFAAGSALILNVVLNLALIPLWGPSGAALASTVAYTAAGLLMLAVFRRDSGFSVREILLPNYIELYGHWQWALGLLFNGLRRASPLQDER